MKRATERACEKIGLMIDSFKAILTKAEETEVMIQLGYIPITEMKRLEQHLLTEIDTLKKTNAILEKALIENRCKERCPFIEAKKEAEKDEP